MSEYATGYRCGICGEEYWNANETTATIQRKEYKDDAVTTTVWEFHVCDECLQKVVEPWASSRAAANLQLLGSADWD